MNRLRRANTLIFSAVLRAEMRLCGVSISQLASTSGVSAKSIYNYHSALVYPGVARRQVLASALNVCVSAFSDRTRGINALMAESRSIRETAEYDIEAIENNLLTIKRARIR